MLKDILKKVANLLGRKDIAEELEKSDKLSDITCKSIQSDISNLIMNFNFIVSAIFEHYLDLIYCDKVASNSSGEIDYNKLSFHPLKIVKVEDESFYVMDFVSRCNYLKVCSPNRLYYVSYKFVPNPLGDLTDEVSFFTSEVERAVCYGVAGEFLSSNGKYSEANFWSEKLISELFKIKAKKERRVKSTFCLWKKL